MTEEKGNRPEGPTTEHVEKETEEDVESLKSRLEKCENECSAYKDMLQRLQADFSNYRKRREGERAEEAKMAGQNLVKGLLPILDDFTRALDSVPQEEGTEEWVQGVKMIQGKLVTALEQAGLSKIEAKGKRFDPFEHEAIGVDEVDDVEDGTITTVHQDGYKFHGKILRPAQVFVAKNSNNSNE